MNDIDVIIPVYKPDDSFNELIEKLLVQTFVPDRIIIMWTIPVDGQFDEERYMSLPGHDKLEIIKVPQKEFDHGGTRKQGISHSSAEYVLLMTQDAIPADNNLIENLHKQFYNNEVAAAYARQLPRDDASYIERISRGFNYPDKERIQKYDRLSEYGIKTFFCSDVCAMYRRASYDEAGGFTSRAIFNEDMIMASSLIKMGYTVIYTPDAKVYHSHDYSFKTQFKRNFDLAVSQAEHPEVFESVPSESEGRKYVIYMIKNLIKKGRIHLIPKFFIQSVYKYFGYKKGKNYKNLSNKKIMRYTMNKYYWNNIQSEEIVNE